MMRLRDIYDEELKPGDYVVWSGNWGTNFGRVETIDRVKWEIFVRIPHIKRKMETVEHPTSGQRASGYVEVHSSRVIRPKEWAVYVKIDTKRLRPGQRFHKYYLIIENWLKKQEEKNAKRSV